MQTQVIATEDLESIETAVRTLRAGGLVAFPTDTVYGLGALLSLPDAVQRIYDAKGRPLEKAVPLLLSGADTLCRFARDIPGEAWVLTEKFWPGALTLVLWRKPLVPDVVTGGGPTVAVRVPDHPFTLTLLDAAGGALATTSANLAGHPDSQTAEDVLRHLDGLIDLVVDGGACPGGVPSTVIDVSRIPPVVVRDGAISRQELEEVLVRLP
jgi:L-threonylcarbamoyladenylate synthase